MPYSIKEVNFDDFFDKYEGYVFCSINLATNF